MINKKLSKLQGFIQGEWNWPISCLNALETQERGPCAQTPIEDCTFSARLGNQSVFSLDQHMMPFMVSISV